MSENIDLYTIAHKGQRGMFFKIAKWAGTLNIADKEEVDKFSEELLGFREQMRIHAALEEKLIHPLLAERVPGGARRLEDDHRVMHQQFDDLVADLDALKAKAVDFEKNRGIVLEFYRGWNRFLVFYFSHIDFEEEGVMPTLWKVSTGQELGDVFKRFLASLSFKELTYHLEMMLPAMNLTERVTMLTQGKASMPPEAFQSVLKVAEHALNAEDWKVLKTKLGLT